MALRGAGKTGFAPIEYRTCPVQEKKHKSEVETLKKELDEAKRKQTIRHAMTAPVVEPHPSTDQFESERAQLIEDINKLHRECAELRRFQRPVQTVERIVEQRVEVEKIVEKFVEVVRADWRYVSVASFLCSALGLIIGKVFL